MAKAKTTKKKTAETSDVGDQEVTVDRRTTKSGERRKTTTRRKKAEPVAKEQRSEPRRKVSRRRQIDPTTCERDYNNEEIEFMHALDEYKRSAGRMFPTCSEILEVLRGMGYRRLTADQLELIAPPQPSGEAEDGSFQAEGGETSDLGMDSEEVLEASLAEFPA